MSEFHGGFYLSRVDGDVQAPVLAAMRAHLTGIALSSHALAFATRKGAPIMHCALRGPVADGKDCCFFHMNNEALGAELARAIGAVVWSYYYENQTGSEGIVRYEADGREAARAEHDWDTLADALGIEHSAAGHAVLMAKLPLGVLAAELKVPRTLVDMVLAYDTPSCTIALDGDGAPGALARYLAEDLLDMPAAPSSEEGRSQSLYFPSTMASELTALARRLGVSVGKLLWAAWEYAKPELHANTPKVNDTDEEAGATMDDRLVAPPPQAPTDLSVPATAAQAPDLAATDNKAKLSVVLPERVLEEIQTLAHFADRSLSWVVQRAYLRTRDRLVAAR
jgi:uncharacterized small protein (TIGR04563 family)